MIMLSVCVMMRLSHLWLFSPTLGLRLTGKAIDVLFGFEPFFDTTVRQAREKIVKRADIVGISWSESIDGMRRNMDELEGEYDRLLDRKVLATCGYLLPPSVYIYGGYDCSLAVSVCRVSVQAF